MPSKSPHTRDYHKSSGDTSEKLMLMLCGGTAGCTAKTICSPLERAKLLSQTGAARGLSNILQTIIREEGVRAFWRGNAVNCLRVFPNKGILLGCNDMFKGCLSDIPDRERSGQEAEGRLGLRDRCRLRYDRRRVHLPT